MRIGMFSDIHFQPKGLERIVATSGWIIEEFKRQRVDRVHCLGDVLNTREEVDVGAQSSALAFFSRLADEFPVDVILGNHDMHLKHARKVSSLDGLALHPRIRLHREVGIVRHAEADGSEHLALMVPYHEDQSQIIQAIQGMQAKAPAELLKRVVAYGHLGINGAVKITRYNSRFTGAVGPDSFAPFRRTFTGHFHVHQELAHRVVYLGSPLQFNFGDAGDARGIIVYDTVADTWQHIVNPHHDAFRIVAVEDLPQVFAAPESYRNTFVTVLYDDVTTDENHEDVRKRLEAIGVIDVKRESVVDRAIREHQVEVGAVKATSVLDLVEPFVRSVLKDDSQIDPAVATAFAKGIIQKINAGFQDVADTGGVFDARLTMITIRNFMGVQDEIVLDLASMADGVWFFEGKVGAGKSTVLEALCWCLFDEVMRSGMKADDVINDVAGRDCMVSVSFANGYSFIRYRKASFEHPTGIRMDGTGVKVFKDWLYLDRMEKGSPIATQAGINDLLGITFEALSKAVVLGQSLATNFVSAGDKERRAILESMLGLERFDAYLEEVRELKKQLLAEADQQTSIQQIKAGELSRITDAIAGIDRQVEHQRVAHKTALDAAAQRVHDHQNSLRTEREAVRVVTIGAKAREADASVKMEAARQHLASFDLTAKQQAEQLRTEADEAERTQLAPLIVIRNRLDQQLAGLQAEARTYQDREAQTAAQKTALVAPDAAAIDIADEQLWKLNNGIGHYEMQAKSYDEHAALVKPKAQALQAEIERLTKLHALGGGGEHCPTCKQALDAKAIGELLEQQKTKISELASGLQFQKALSDQAVVSRATMLKERELLIATMPKKEHLAAYEATVRQFDKVLAETTILISGLAERALVVQRTADDEAGKLVGDQTRLVGLQEAMRTVTERIADLRRRSAAAAASFDDAKYQAALKNAQHATLVWNDSTLAYGTEVAAAEENVRKLEHLITESEALLAKLKGEDPAAALLETKTRQEGDWRRVQDELEGSKRLSATISQKQTYVTFWDKAFAAKGGMRAFLMEDSVVALNQVIQGYMQVLSLQGHTLNFKPDLTVVERYAKRSGGQRKVTDIAVLLGMREVVAQRSRFRAGFLFLDEIFDALDAEHRKAVQELLVVLAQRVPKVFVITHVPFTGVSITGTMQAELTGAGTRIEVKAV